MPLSMWWWIGYAAFVLWGGWWGWRGPAEARWPWGGQAFILAILLLIAGLKLFGGPVTG